MTSPSLAAPLTSPPPFTCGGVVFACYLRPDGGYVWRSGCGRIACGRWERRYIVKVDGELLAEGTSLVQVMALGVARLGLPDIAPKLQRVRTG